MKEILLPVAHVFALVMMVFAATMLAPLVMAVWGLDPALSSFVISAFATFFLGALLWLCTRRFKRELKTRDGLMLVALTWVALPAVAGFPLWNYLPINFTDAYFEAASGLTTTGGTVLSGLEFLPRSINLWRHLLSWLGGMGIIVLAVAILPMLGVGGMQIYRAEMTKDHSAGSSPQTAITRGASMVTANTIMTRAKTCATGSKMSFTRRRRSLGRVSRRLRYDGDPSRIGSNDRRAARWCRDAR